MNNRILPPAVERYEIHTATCRARRQGLACSTCSDLHERAVISWVRHIAAAAKAA
jgi:hypothetical protein